MSAIGDEEISQCVLWPTEISANQKRVLFKLEYAAKVLHILLLNFICLLHCRQVLLVAIGGFEGTIHIII